ncbi:hypothetical protein L5515_005497 [Caenorhabditis briggsae]|uniref:F-box domain-containing protein n=1 Tax=Caenorhabditis briggsae TaxID=6238 RepID=A0AAE9EQB7_CAEBR|nr:hypothetical protein L5515_005497 [Caenorhabditis briggsae]
MPFDLPQLPENVILEVLRNLEFREIILFSLLSTNSRKRVSSLQIKASHINMFFHATPKIRCSFPNPSLPRITFELPAALWKVSFKNYPASFKLSGIQRGKCERIFTGCLKSGDLFEHLYRIFNYRREKHVVFYPGCQKVNPDLIFKDIGDVPSIIIAAGSQNDNARRVLRTFKRINKLCLEINPFEDPNDLQTLLTRNFYSLTLSNSMIILRLEDLLMINAVHCSLIGCRIELRTINRFFKLWLAGSNPRLAHLKIEFPEPIPNPWMSICGIWYQRIPEDQERVVDTVGEVLWQNRIHGGFDVRRRDGRKATFRITSTAIRLFVWMR